MTLAQLSYAVAIANENSLNDAAKKLFISQPSLSAALHSMEEELGFELFYRSRSGITITPKGAEFVGYARSVLEQYELLDARYISKTHVKRSFSVSMQHYTFAVNAFVELVREYGMDDYEFEVYETKTHEVIDNVKNQKSELGILYMNDYNSTVLNRILADAGLEFTPLFECNIYAYMAKSNPLAKEKLVTLEQLDEYPCLGFDQGDRNSFYFAEEVMSNRACKQMIRGNDRATLLNLAKGLNGYTLCSGIICEDLNGSDFVAVKVDTAEKMTIGYIARKNSIISEIGHRYLKEIEKYKEQVLA